MTPMRFTSMRTPRDLAGANRAFLDVFHTRASRARTHTIGTAGGSVVTRTWHLPALDLWVASQRLHNRTWNALGIGDPFAKSAVAPVMELNFPLKAGAANTAGVALRDERGATVFGHTGRVGGGKPGVGMSAFKAFHPMTADILVDDAPRDVYLLGSDAQPERLVANVSEFTHMVDDFKQGARSSAQHPPLAREFRPEFEGVAEYTLSATDRAATYTHGRVINALYRTLRERGIHAQRTRLIDLFASPTRTHEGVIFEAKTWCDTQSVYTCVGQLTLLPPDRRWQRVAVLPSPVTPRLAAALGDVGIFVLEYELTGPAASVTFANLTKLVRRLRRTK